MQRAFDCLSDKIEGWLALWWGALLFILARPFAYHFAGWDGLDRLIYTSDDLVLLLLIGCGRRDTKALLAQNERILKALGVTGFDRLEEREEREIEEARK